ncbi:hypothetical protein [Psychrobacter sp. T6-3]|uniref:hypothetical protein n=1 Tax=Psychrobacter sp. T6-3 TaxID=3457449 RepID=UPI003FD59E7D
MNKNPFYTILNYHGFCSHNEAKDVTICLVKQTHTAFVRMDDAFSDAILYTDGR